MLPPAGLGDVGSPRVSRTSERQRDERVAVSIYSVRSLRTSGAEPLFQSKRTQQSYSATFIDFFHCHYATGHVTHRSLWEDLMIRTPEASYIPCCLAVAIVAAAGCSIHRTCPAPAALAEAADHRSTRRGISAREASRVRISPERWPTTSCSGRGQAVPHAALGSTAWVHAHRRWRAVEPILD